MGQIACGIWQEFKLLLCHTISRHHTVSQMIIINKFQNVWNLLKELQLPGGNLKDSVLESIKVMIVILAIIIYTSLEYMHCTWANRNRVHVFVIYSAYYTVFIYIYINLIVCVPQYDINITSSLITSCLTYLPGPVSHVMGTCMSRLDRGHTSSFCPTHQ